MRDIAFLGGSLAVIALAAAVAPVPMGWRLGATAGLLFLWGYGLARAAGGGLRPTSPVRLLPGHALLFLALGLVGAEAGRWAWVALCPLSLLLDRTRRRSLAATMYAILWLDIFALVHQVVALGRTITGPALALWSGGLALIATLFVANGVRRILVRGVMV